MRLQLLSQRLTVLLKLKLQGESLLVLMMVLMPQERRRLNEPIQMENQLHQPFSRLRTDWA